MEGGGAQRALLLDQELFQPGKYAFMPSVTAKLHPNSFEILWECTSVCSYLDSGMLGIGGVVVCEKGSWGQYTLQCIFVFLFSKEFKVS